MRQQSERRNRYFAFLRRLRSGGRTNMYGAVPYLASAFALDRECAFQIVCEWLDLQVAEETVAPAAARAAAELATKRAPPGKARKLVERKERRGARAA